MMPQQSYNSFFLTQITIMPCATSISVSELQTENTFTVSACYVPAGVNVLNQDTAFYSLSFEEFQFRAKLKPHDVLETQQLGQQQAAWPVLIRVNKTEIDLRTPSPVKAS